MTSRVAIVHNGIIENFRDLRLDLEAHGAIFESETDTEVVAHLLDRELKAGAEPAAAVKAVLIAASGRVRSAILFSGHEDLRSAHGGAAR